MNPSQRTPVTILTGFLGAGKTTLLNRILTEHHGLRLAVIENEFGEVGIDHELVIQADEEIFEMNNGCICCTVRGDLLRILGRLMKRRDQFDHILIETTGLADPGPVVQTFFVDEDLREKLFVNAVVTLVDARHVGLHLEDSEEVQKQIAVADVLVLNKADLVEAEDLARLESRVKSLNHLARCYRATQADVPLADILQLGGFDLERAIGQDPHFLEPEFPFEWGGIVDFSSADAAFVATEAPDPTMRVVLVPVPAATREALDAAREKAVLAFAEKDAPLCPSGQALNAQGGAFDLVLAEGEMRWPVVGAPGLCALFTEHAPHELSLSWFNGGQAVEPVEPVIYKPDHHHDDAVTSVGLEIAGECDGQKLNQWLSVLLREQGADIFRMKGVFAVEGNPNRVIFQGVHMLLDAQDGGPWGHRPRRNSLVFIGRELQREELTHRFRQCLV